MLRFVNDNDDPFLLSFNGNPVQLRIIERGIAMPDLDSVRALSYVYRHIVEKNTMPSNYSIAREYGCEKYKIFLLIAYLSFG